MYGAQCAINIVTYASGSVIRVLLGGMLTLSKRSNASLCAPHYNSSSPAIRESSSPNEVGASSPRVSEYVSITVKLLTVGELRKDHLISAFCSSVSPAGRPAFLSFLAAVTALR